LSDNNKQDFFYKLKLKRSRRNNLKYQRNEIICLIFI